MLKITLQNKLGITDSFKLVNEEEKISKKKALDMFQTGVLDSLKAGSIEALIKIHKYLFEDIYEFAGIIRTANIAKGNFRFAPAIYLNEALNSIEKMPQSTFDEIIEKYVEMTTTISRQLWSMLMNSLCKPYLYLKQISVYHYVHFSTH